MEVKFLEGSWALSLLAGLFWECLKLGFSLKLMGYIEALLQSTTLN